ncbi:Aspartyl/asparaginyl beta-hydroxylase-like [Oopsacas minuta]|uniref:Aspartyl/asparaginyl beta-hydroxylase-like n=1 Tax=Oopsacas minuta TaxID=111878 RepID=A0AAV7JK98_9METZ|nr:Aspartyl/asparaginyl beta-hydroxylase-like [Oopsacas minuta]
MLLLLLLISYVGYIASESPIISFPIEGQPPLQFFGSQDVCKVLFTYCNTLPLVEPPNCVAQIHIELIRQFTRAWESIISQLTIGPEFFIDCVPLNLDASQVPLFNSNFIPDYVPPDHFTARNSTHVVNQLLGLLKLAMKRDSKALAEFNRKRTEIELTDPERVSLYTQAVLLLPTNLFVLDQFGLSLLYAGKSTHAYKLFRNAVALGMWGEYMQRPVSKYVPGLTAIPWHDPTKYSVVKILENGYRAIREEFLYRYHNNQELFTTEQESLHMGGDWTEVRIKSSGHGLTEVSELFPQTLQTISNLPPDTFTSVKFSVIQSGTHIRTHTGPSNERLRIHLCVYHIGGARIRVMDKWHGWQEGKAIVFDDSFEHEVVNLGADFRAVLILDIWHPELPIDKRIVH